MTDSDPSVVKILLTTDNHLGYMERDEIRKEDSFVTFDEALSAGRTTHDVDLVLLAGDLFHENKPSLKTLTRTMEMFRRHVFGDKEVSIALASDPKVNFPSHPFPLANFQDPNLNIAMPVFTIHGNHDDPIAGTSALDVLAQAGLVNYFGQAPFLDDIVIRPVLLRKGNTRLAIYGLGNVRDERLHRSFTLGKVRFVKPKNDSHRWFNLCVLHQNRGVRPAKGMAKPKAGITEEMLAPFKFDLIIWGNEHEQRLIPEPIAGSETEIIQPGSSILTSLGSAECNPKQYGILQIRGTDYKVDPYPLRSVRPVVRRSIVLWKENLSKSADAVEEFLLTVAHDMLAEAQDQIKALPEGFVNMSPNLVKPLMRLAVDFSDPSGSTYPQPNVNRFGHHFVEEIANPSDMLKAVKPPPAPRVAAINHGADADAAAGVVHEYAEHTANAISTTDIRSKIAEVFQANAKDACTVLSEPEVSSAVYTFVEKAEKTAITEKVEMLVEQCQKSVWKKMRNGVDIEAGGFDPSEVVRYASEAKAELNKKFYDMQKREGFGLDENDPELMDIMGMGHEGAVAAAAAATASRMPGGAPLPTDDELQRVRPAGGGGGVYEDAEDIIAAHAAEAAAATAELKATKAKKAASKKSTAASKRSRATTEAEEGGDDVIDVDANDASPAPAPRAKKAPAAKKETAASRKKAAAEAAASTGPTLKMTSAPAPPPPNQQTFAGARNIMSKWGK